MKILPKFLRGRSVFFWIILVQLIGFSLLTISVDFQPESIASWFARFADSPFGIPATILIYLLAAFVNAPQWMLHGGAVLAFGPVQGAIIAWVATMISASFDFWLGRRLGADRVNRMSGAHFGKFLKVVQQHGFWASLIVRIVPAGPFVLVNLAAGVARIKFPAFFIGTGIGTIPKIIMVTSLTEGMRGSAVGKGPLYVAIVVGIALLWMGIIYVSGSKLKGKSAQADTETKETK